MTYNYQTDNKQNDFETEIICPIHPFIKYKIYYKNGCYGGGNCHICSEKRLKI